MKERFFYFIMMFFVLAFFLRSITPVEINCIIENQWENGTKLHEIWCTIKDSSGNPVENAVVNVNGEILLRDHRYGTPGYWYQASGLFTDIIRLRVTLSDGTIISGLFRPIYGFIITKPAPDSVFYGVRKVTIDWKFVAGRMRPLNLKAIHRGRVLEVKRGVIPPYILEPSKWRIKFKKAGERYEVIVFLTGPKLCSSTFKGDVLPRSKICMKGFAFVEFVFKSLLPPLK